MCSAVLNNRVVAIMVCVIHIRYNELMGNDIVH